MEYFDKIESYLLGYMPESNRTAFEAEIGTNPDLAKAIQLHQSEHEAMRLLRREALKAQMRGWKAGGDIATAQIEQEAPVVRPITTMTGRWSRTKFIQMAVAACFALVAAWYFLQPSAINGAQLAMNGYPNWPETVRDASAPADPMDAAIERLKKNDDSGLVLLEQIPATHPKYHEVPLLKSDFYFRRADYLPAIAICERIANDPTATTDLQQKAAWRLAMAYLAKDGLKSTLFKQVFNDIIAAGEGHFHAKDAQKLLKSLQ